MVNFCCNSQRIFGNIKTCFFKLSTDFLGEDLVGIDFVFFLASTDFLGEDLVGVVFLFFVISTDFF